LCAALLLIWVALAAGAPQRAIVAPAGLSAGAAIVADSSVRLNFGGALDAAGATDATRYTISINDQTATMASVSYSAVGNAVTLALPPAVLKAGDRVVVSWRELRDAQGRLLSGQTLPLTAR